MRSLTRDHWITIGAAVLLIVLLLFVPILPSKKGNPAEMKQPLSLEEMVSGGRKRLKPLIAARLTNYEKLLAKFSDKEIRKQIYDSAASLAWQNREVALSLYFSEQRAKDNSNSSEEWRLVGERYLYGKDFVVPEAQPAFINAATRSFEKAITISPNNIDAKIGLSRCYIEGGTDPMKGIGMLRTLEQADSSNIKVQLALGDASVMSGQLDKAVTRYEHALRIDTGGYYIWLRLADVYRMKKDVAGQITSLKKYAARETDSAMKADVLKEIEQLSQSK